MPMLSGAHNLTANNSTFVDQSTKLVNNTSHNAQITINSNHERTGLRILLAASTPEASHDSSARYPPPRCHPGTRTEYIQRLTQWGLNVDNHTDSIVWVKGPAGTGKSAIAQSYAEALGEKLGATFFFSRPNKRDNPNRFFTSISHQLAVNFDPYGDLLDRKITHNPTLVKKAIPHQFSDLIVTPIHQLKLEGKEFPERVIIVDGLDECADAGAQVDIVKIIAESARTQSTPFLWVFFSRLEPNILAVFDSPEVKLISLPIVLEVSREIDGDIALYLTDKLLETAQKHSLALPWPRESEIWVLVDYSNGLFACAHAISHFIDDRNSAGPAEQLCAVLDLAKYSTQNASNHPLSGLNSFYTLVMERIPSTQLQTVQWILLATRMPRILDAVDNANLLRLSELQFRNACRYLHSVMTVPDDEEPRINFYHASFMDFLEDPARSRQFCIWSGCAVALFDELLPRFDHISVTCDSGEYRPGTCPIP
ncbi:hypothetical protein P691DRAFT_807851 [Macrolepiota fuliginosa MF-IS2]|uniref:Nephrocystin 3-like N-terminal domain-containing protein n=1 Tax=Macrolepiota fuliginosa MF-IS2 TaxID=1400762 RepID=A0A9P6BXL6_9AGAR|nr:hypothetical protein P691DRAFT_807851 [Macrolepiota fuliginosa MF-IS2]